MVGLVIVSHSEKVAQGVVELCRQMAPEAPMAPAGGLPDGGIGTDFQRIYDAIDQVKSDDGVAIFFDMGSALMTTEMVMEAFPEVTMKLVDAPILEGAIAASVTASLGQPLEAVLEAAHEATETPKLLD